jgi:hypothetical protein
MMQAMLGHCLQLRRFVLVVFAGMAMGACSDCPNAFELTERRVVRPGEQVVLTAPDGELHVVGRERMAMLEIEARGCRARGDERIAADSGSMAGLRVVARHADVRAIVPAGTELVVRHGSGPLELRALGPTVVEQRGDDARLDQFVGPVSVRAGAGTLYVRDVVGDVEIVDGPGAVFIEGIMGSVRVRDGSGGIHLREVEGDAVVDGDGSGAIDARTIGGDFVVRAKIEDRNMVRYDDVAGAVSIPE